MMTDLSLAPDLPDTLAWVNCGPVRLETLRGRVLALVFWHAGSASSANLLAELAQLQMTYADGLRVIGLHVPRFDAQRDPEFVAHAVNRLGVRFPVASDPDAVTWQHYGIRAWPTVALVDVEGRLVELIAGDHQLELLDQRIASLLEDAGERGLRIFENAQAVSHPEPLTEVAFPAGLAVTSDRLHVSDSGHHRVLECDHQGRVLRVFGSGSAGLADGLGLAAAFHSPCGLARVGNTLYVADTGNHAIRQVQLETGEVGTLVGCGQAGVVRASPDVRREQVRLDRPCGVAADGSSLFIAMTASNQIWVLNLSSFSLHPLAGSGRMGTGDGVGALAEFAQPAGMMLASECLYVCDSLSSALRRVRVKDGSVDTLIGRGLFEFGDEEGDRDLALLQYPLDVALDPTAPMLWIADSYNNAIGGWHLEGGGLVRFPLDHALRCPSAIASSGAHLWIANTDAHEVLRMDVASGEIVVLPMSP